MIVVISQPMLFPWPGMIEQILLADVYVDYPDVQFSKGSFVNRVQLMGPGGRTWLTVPLKDLRLGQKIEEVRINDSRDWAAEHLGLLRACYRDAPFLDDAVDVMRAAYAGDHGDIGSLALASTRAVCRYLGIDLDGRLKSAPALGIGGRGSQRVLDIVSSLGGTTYVTGHGARHYLDHEAFDAAGIEVRYMDYALTPYPQRREEFCPYVSCLDLVANTGPGAGRYLQPRTLPWREFVSR